MNTHNRGKIAVWATAILIGAGAMQFADAQLSFVDVAPEWGVNHVAEGGKAFPFDYDGDRDLDLFQSSRYGDPDLMFRNDGDHFTRLDNIGLSQTSDGLKSVPMDFDHDGDLDLLLGCYHTSSQLLVNENGVFVNRASELGLPNWTGARDLDWVDINQDGWMDIMMGFVSHGWLLLRNDQGTFTDITDDVQLPPTTSFRRFGATDADFDGDLDLFMTTGYAQDYFYENTGNGLFVDQTVAAGLSNAVGQVGCLWADFDGDKYPDILTQASDHHTIWHNNHDLTFTEMSVHGADQIFSMWANGSNYGVADFDLDGDLDIYAGLPTGEWPGLMPNQFLRMDSVRGLDIWFTDIAPELGMDFAADTYPTVFDLDNDGDMDLVLRHYGDATRIMRNDINVPHRLEVEIVGPNGEIDCWQTRVEAYAHGTNTLLMSAVTDFDGARRNGFRHYLTLDEHNAYDLHIYFANGDVMLPVEYPALEGIVPSEVAHLLTVHRGGTITGGPTAPVPAAADYALDQNYPNPFNPETSITFSLSQTRHATLTVYNTLGQIVATLLDGPLSAGRHTVAFSGQTLPSGLYFYRLTAGDFTAIRKMVLMK